MKHLKLAIIFILPFFNGLKAQSWVERLADNLTPFEKEFVRGALNYGEPDMRNHPYTMFNKNRTPDFHWTSDVILIRLELMKSQGKEPAYASYAAKIYEALYRLAISDKPNVCNQDAPQCEHPRWVKANALINMIRLKIDVVGGVYVVTSIDNPPLGPVNNSFGDKAKHGLRELTTKVDVCWGLGGNCSNVRNRATQLINYLQAYDMLKTVSAIPTDLNVKDSERDKLRRFTSELYIASSRIINSNRGWKKNHGIICASALGMASIVLGESGGKWDRYDPKKWFDRAHGTRGTKNLEDYCVLRDCDDGLEDNFFHGRHNWNAQSTPTTNSKGTAGAFSLWLWGHDSTS